VKCHGFDRQWSTAQFPPLKLNSTTRARQDPRGPAWTLSETRTDPTEFLGDPGQRGSGRVGVVEFGDYAVQCLQTRTCCQLLQNTTTTTSLDNKHLYGVNKETLLQKYRTLIFNLCFPVETHTHRQNTSAVRV